ncbi:hypothetical protein BDF22DRAFT_682089 [Syncephalis plumigaleata]|nr:hypothetical protein BDF22DRAFT_682089 [Syncephalis plumigaleata]
MATNNYAVEDLLGKLETDLDLLRYPQGVRASNIKAYTPIFTYLLTEFSHPITAFLENQPGQPDTEPWTIIIDRISLYRLLREQLNEPHPRLTEAQLFDSTTSADEKLDWMIHVLRLFRYWHNDLLLERKSKFEPPLQTKNANQREKAYSIVGSTSGKHPKQSSSFNRVYTDAISRKPIKSMEFEYALDTPTESAAINGGATGKHHEFHRQTRSKPDLPDLIGTSTEVWSDNRPHLDSKELDQLVQIQQEIQTEIHTLISKLYKLESQLTTVTDHLGRYQSNRPSTSNRHPTDVDVINRILPKDPIITSHNVKDTNKYNSTKKDVLQEERGHPLLQYPSRHRVPPVLNNEENTASNAVRLNKTNPFIASTMDDPLAAVNDWRNNTFRKNHWAIADDETIHSNQHHHRRRRLPDAYKFVSIILHIII